MQPPSMTLYGAEISPFAMRVVLQCRLKGLEIPMRHPDGGVASEAFARINPIGKIPVLEIGDRRIPESEVICEYLEDAFPEPSLRPADPLERARVRLISRIADQYVMNAMLPLFKNLDRTTRDQAVVAFSLEALGKGLGWLDSYIRPGPFAVGETITLADCAVAPILVYVERFPRVFGMKEPLGGLANLAAYWRAIRGDRRVDAVLREIEASLDALRPAKVEGARS